MKKTLGGERLGTGSKMKVDLHGFARSNHDLSKTRRMTISAGTIVPIMSTIALPGDTWDIRIRAALNTHPTLGPLFASMKLQIDSYLAPLKLYISRLLYNELEIGLKMENVLLPQVRMNSIQIDPSTHPDLDNAQVNPSSIMACLGLRGIGLSIAGDRTRDFNAVGILMYWDVYKNYYANRQEKIGAVIHTPAVANNETVDEADIFVINGGVQTLIVKDPLTMNEPLKILTTFEIHYNVTAPIGIMILTLEKGAISLEDICGTITDDGTTLLGQYNWFQFGNLTLIGWRYRNETDAALKPEIATFPLANLDQMRRDIIKHDDSVFIIDDTSIAPYGWIPAAPNGIPNIISSQEGLGLKTYNSDLFNNWLETETITGAGGINEISAVSTVGDNFEIPDLIIARKVYEMLNRIAVSGGSVEDWIGAQWVEKQHRECTTPMYMGGLIQEVTFQEVINNSASTTETGGQPLGTLAGTGRLGNKKGGNVTIRNIEDPSWILMVASLTPRIDYSQGNKWHMHLKTMADLHVPMMDEIGFQDLITEQMAWWDTTYDDGTNKWIQKSAGKQPAWINYMTEVNEVLGNFAIANNEMFMVLNRRYEFEAGTIKDLTTYIDPAKFNFIFAETSLDSQNYWLQVGIDAEVRRLMSAKLMPML